MINVFLILIMVMLSQKHTDMKISQFLHSIYIQFIVYQLYLSKAIFKNLLFKKTVMLFGGFS